MKRPKRRKRGPNTELQQRIDAVREEARRTLEREGGKMRRRVQGSRSDPSEAMIRVRGLVAETKRRTAPIVRSAVGGAASALRPIAPIVTGALFAAVRATALAIAAVLEVLEAMAALTADRAGAFAVRVRPAGTVAAIAALAAVALAGSQFADYRGVEVSSVQYSGEVGSVAPAPLTDTETPISAHSVTLLGIAALALLTIWTTVRGRWRFGRLVGLLGAIAIGVSIGIDAPKGLDAGTAGVAFEDTSAELIEGFWAQVAAAATLLVLGPLLGRYVRSASGERSPGGVPSAERSVRNEPKPERPGAGDRGSRQREERRRRREDKRRKSGRTRTSAEPA